MRMFALKTLRIPRLPRLCFWLGALLVAGTLGVLEWRFPYFFVDDDSHRQYLPMVIRMAEGFFATGRLPLWDAYTGLGSSLINGSYPLTYPPLYVSYLLCALIRLPTAMIDVFSWLHLLAAYALLFATFRRMGATPFLGMCAATSLALSGYHLAMGRAWISIPAVSLYMAAFLWLLTFVLEGRALERKWVLFTGLSMGMFYHVGHPQYWLYGMMAFTLALALALLTQKLHRLHNMLMVLAGFLAGLAIASPLLVLQWYEQQHVAPILATQYRDAGIAEAQHYLLRLWSPYFSTPEYQWWGTQLFAGGVYTPLAIAACAGILLLPLRRRPHAHHILALTALFCFILSVGSKQPLWEWLQSMPVFSKFRFVNKWTPVLHAFIAAAGVAFLITAMRRYPRIKIAAHAAVCLGLAASLYNAQNSIVVLSHMADRPFPPLPPIMANLRFMQQNGAAPYRAITAGNTYSGFHDFTLSLNNNYPSYYGIFSANRYNQRVSTTPGLRDAIVLAHRAPAIFLTRFSIGWVIKVKQDGHTDSGPDYEAKPLIKRAKALDHVPLILPQRIIYDVRSATPDPLVYYTDNTRPPALPFEVKPDGLLIDASAITDFPTAITASFLSHPWFRAYGEPGNAPLAVLRDSYQRIRLVINKPVSSIRLALTPPWWHGGLVALLCLALAGGCCLVAQRLR